MADPIPKATIGKVLQHLETLRSLIQEDEMEVWIEAVEANGKIMIEMEVYVRPPPKQAKKPLLSE